VSKQPETAAKQPAKPELHKVKLAKAHTHAGKPCSPGTTIEVTTPERNFLVGVGVIEGLNTTDGAAPAAE